MQRQNLQGSFCEETHLCTFSSEVRHFYFVYLLQTVFTKLCFQSLLEGNILFPKSCNLKLTFKCLLFHTFQNVDINECTQHMKRHFYFVLIIPVACVHNTRRIFSQKSPQSIFHSANVYVHCICSGYFCFCSPQLIQTSDRPQPLHPSALVLPICVQGKW